MSDHRSRPRTWDERGSVTAEFSVTLPVVVFLLAVLLGAGSAAMQQVRLEEAARALGLSTTTAHRHWNYARAWLHQAIVAEGPTGGEETAR